MTTQTIEIKKAFITNNETQFIVFENEMQAGFKYQLASIEDLHNYVSVSGEYFTHSIETSEGVVRWYTEDTEDFGYVCEYRVIN
ncbi:hypothetical protein [Peribacillus simplex]|uniref:hypothetical protein n=1 Tax=Peribacillus simplex TaxID=1478 RepID=UPI003D27D7E3